MYDLDGAVETGNVGNNSQDYEDRYVDINSVNTRYWQAGENGSPVILVHGLGSYVESWLTLFEPLAENHRVYAFDLIGFGRTDKPKGAYTYLFFAEFLFQFMRALKIERASIVGCSLGGGTVLQFSINHANMVDKLILIGSGGLGPRFSLALRLMTVPILGKLLSSSSRKGSYQALEYQVYDPSIIQDEWVDMDYAMSAIPGVQKKIIRTLRAGATLFGGRSKVLNPIISNLSSIEASTLIIWGKQDPVIPVEYANVAHEGIANSELFLLDRCGHAPFLEYPAKVNEKIIDFLNEQEKTTGCH